MFCLHWEARMRNVQRRRLRIFVFVILLFGLILLGCAMFPSMAREEGPRPAAYYKSIQIEEGDSLWEIAGRYKQGGNLTTADYVDKLKTINRLTEDTIHAGQYLTIVYYKSAGR